MEHKRNGWLVVAGVAGFLGVALGAFGAHLLRSLVSPQALGWWQTAVEYHLVHGVLLGGLALAPGVSRARTVALGAFTAGILLFSGSLYLMALTGVLWLGAVTPLGGVAFLVGWASVIVLGWKATRS